MTIAPDLIQPDRGQDATPIHLVNTDTFETFAKGLSGPQRAALEAQKFNGGGYQVGIVPAKNTDDESWFAVGGVADPDELSAWCMAKLAEQLPAGTYRRAENHQPGPAMFGWMTAQYRFDRYRKEDDPEGPRILLTKDAAKIDLVTAEAQAASLVRDLVNTPAEDMGPAALEDEAERIAKAYDAKLEVARGDTLEKGFPMVHAVGRAAARSHAPRLIELDWGSDDHPRVAIVGKGVCFDSGGLSMKTGRGMLLMKKDMGGAAHALALAELIMKTGLKVRLHCVVPAVENAVAGNAFRPGDVLQTRKGLTVEISNTDAEGRLILGDALTLASEHDPELIIDFATLTGAARVALGPDLPALMARRDQTAEQLIAAGKDHDDEPWRLPLQQTYAEWLKSEIADTDNSHSNGFAGASVAGLFLDKFVGENIDWAHFDTFAWNPQARPGRSKGGAALGLRAAFHMLRGRYG
ncbi:leucyl aminopeptidase family protein [Aurantiacibacter gangjinensis]|uniref:Cytosol aminopeptidase n=1 Tax=Aurantiacibacter gangjinensis TaxID=502682 RepID=A0A0G9MRU7_9SPHN|nr:leucyl aminopeptidase family protein [Aurantiacibacter gangjinensis]APE27031.1 Peptidase B [Aurantiacibacter gangjinensis]KLE33466.1 cytosol aminopeptidase [Aurantiacibacter gangjinensis]